jgi:hypothetical protein
MIDKAKQGLLVGISFLAIGIVAFLTLPFPKNVAVEAGLVIAGLGLQYAIGNRK